MGTEKLCGVGSWKTYYSFRIFLHVNGGIKNFADQVETHKLSLKTGKSDSSNVVMAGGFE
jgi:hypothetical protein